MKKRKKIIKKKTKGRVVRWPPTAALVVMKSDILRFKKWAEANGYDDSRTAFMALMDVGMVHGMKPSKFETIYADEDEY